MTVLRPNRLAKKPLNGVQIADVIPGAGPPHQVIHPDDRQRLVLAEEGLDIQFLADPQHPLRMWFASF